MPNFYTTREIADLLGTLTWRIRRLYEDGTLPAPPRFAGKRAIPGESIPQIVDALRARGWPPEADKNQTSSSTDKRPAEQVSQEQLATT